MRNRKADSKKGSWAADDMEKAIEDILKNNLSERKAAETYNVKRSTLKRRLREARSRGTEAVSYQPYAVSSMRIFSVVEEEHLVQYCLSAAKMGYGLSTLKLRSLAYEYAAKLGKRMPHSRDRERENPWQECGKAGKDWVMAFMKRHPELSVRKPEATSLGRIAAFNRHNVDHFYANVRRVLVDLKLEPHQVWNYDETGVTTVQVPERVIAGRGDRQVAAVTSAERGTLVTMCNAVNACGAAIPPFYIFPRVHFKEVFLRNAIPGSGGAAQRSGWMVESTFIEWFKHFLKHAKPTTDEPMMLLLDNHKTHLSIEFIDLAKENGVTVVTFPPHTSHKMQPLDVSVYGPFKRAYNREIDSWLVSNPGKTVSIYEVAEISGKAWSKAGAPINIMAGFASAGIHPFQPDKWTDDDFSLSQVTDRPNPQVIDDLLQAADEVPVTHSGDRCTPTFESPPSPSVNHSDTPVVSGPAVSGNVASVLSEVTPESVRPFPKAAPRKAGFARKRLSSEILTSTPVKRRLMAEHAERKMKQKGKKCKVTIGEQEANEVNATEISKTCKGKSRSNKAKGKTLVKKSRKKGRDQKDGKQNKVTKALGMGSAAESVKRKPITGRYKPPRSPSKQPKLPRKPVWLTKTGRL